jgi:hypothetical protein
MKNERDRTGKEPPPRDDDMAVRDDEELVDEASDESFPASDPPSFSPLRSGAPKKKPQSDG